MGTPELSNSPRWGREKRANAPSSVNTATFFNDHTVEYTRGARGFSCAVSGFVKSKKGRARKASGSERHPFDSAELITTSLIPKHPGCFADWFLRDIKRFKCPDWITIAIGA